MCKFPEIENIIKVRYENDSSGHDWQHIQRVKKLAVFIADKEKSDKEKAALLALMHEFSDHKLVDDPDAELQKAEKIMSDEKISNDIIKEIISDIPAISFRGAKSETLSLSKNGKIVQDADRLDAMGAIGIARAFAFGGKRGRKMYDKNILPEFHDSFEEYKASEGNTLNHFYEKLFLLKNMMNTETGFEMAKKRHEFMVNFIEQFKLECDL